MTNSRKLLHRSSINVNVNAHVLPILFSLKNLEIIIELFYGRENCLMFPIKALTKTSFKFSKEDSFCEKVHYYFFQNSYVAHVGSKILFQQ